MKILSHFPQNSLLLLQVALITSLSLALYGLMHQFIFGYDQARDAWEAYAIWHDKDLKILGPGTDISGIYHGALWYYFLAIPYAIYHNPLAAGVTVFILSFLTIPLCGLLAFKIFKDKYIVLVSIVLYSLSPLFQVFSRWVSNPVFSVFISPLLLLVLFRYLQKQMTKDAIITGLLLGLFVQSDFAFIIFALFVPIYLIIFRIKPKLKDIAAFLLGFSISMSTFILAEIKFKGRTILSLTDYLSSGSGKSDGFFSLLTSLGNKTLEFLTLAIFPSSKILTLSILLILIFFLIKQKRKDEENKGILFLLFWCTNIFFFAFFKTGISNSIFVYAPSFLALLILTSYSVVRVIKKPLLILLTTVILALAQIYASYSYLKMEYNPMSAQQRIFLQNSKAVIDASYKKAKGKPFSINTITNPLYINTTWAYLYEFYGKNKYGYTPVWTGKDQTGYLGKMTKSEKREDISFLIIEPTIGIPDAYITEGIKEEDANTSLVSEETFGEYRLQQRKLLNK